MSYSQLKYGLEPRYIGTTWIAAFLVLLMFVGAIAMAVTAVMFVRKAINTEQVPWINSDPLTNYPEPVCETCGLPMDGTSAGCQCGGTSALTQLMD